MNLAMLRERIHAADKHPKEVNRTLLDAYAASKACLSADERRWCERVLFGRAGVEQPMGGVMFTRRSVRRYTGEEVCDRDIDSLLEAARWAPSSCNRQPIEIVSVSDPERIQLIAEVRRQPFVAKANRVLAVVVDMESYQTDANYFALLDAGAAIQNMLLAAEAAGLGACWVNMCPAGRGFDAVHKLLAIPKSHRIVSLVAVGHPAGRTRTPGRKVMLPHTNTWE